MFNPELPFNYALPNVTQHINTYAQKILESRAATAAAAAAVTTLTPPSDIQALSELLTPTTTAAATTIGASAATPLIAISSNQVSNLQVAAATTSELIQRLSATLFQKIHAQAAAGNLLAPASAPNGTQATHSGMDLDYPTNHIVIDSSSFDTMDELHKQLAYDKLMNDVWIGVVLTLVLISLVFCICSCFLYHQFRTWKRNYHSTVLQTANAAPGDLEASTKLHGDLEDPVPEYTLVSGLPTYEAALELLQHRTMSPSTPTPLPPTLPSPAKAPSCLFVYPSVFNVFAVNEKDIVAVNGASAAITAVSHKAQHATAATTPPTPTKATALTTATLTAPTMATTAPTTLQQSQSITEVTTPLLSRAATATAVPPPTTTTTATTRTASIVAAIQQGTRGRAPATTTSPTNVTTMASSNNHGVGVGVGGVKCFMLPTYGNVCGTKATSALSSSSSPSAYDNTNNNNNNNNNNNSSNKNAITIVIPDISAATNGNCNNNNNNNNSTTINNSNNSGHVNGHGIGNGKSTTPITRAASSSSLLDSQTASAKC